ncbi:MAG: hypothetical protein ACRDAO_00945 [Culicoidibacterales bacterium]
MGMKFPMNYFVSFVQPAKIYRWRKQYTWPKIIMLFIFTIAFTFLPVSFLFFSMTSFQMEMFIPNAMKLVDDDMAKSLADCTFNQGVMSCTTTAIEKTNGVVAIAPEQAYQLEGTGNNIQVVGIQNAIIFAADELILTDENGVGFQVKYPNTVTKLDVENRSDVSHVIGSLWYSQFRPVVIPVVMIAVAAMLFVTLGVYFGFVALVLYMMKHSRMVEIDTIKEAIAMIIMAAGLPTLLAVGVCFITQDIAVLLTIQSFGMLAMLLIAYFMTRFRSPILQRLDKYEQQLSVK